MKSWSSTMVSRLLPLQLPQCKTTVQSSCILFLKKAKRSGKPTNVCVSVARTDMVSDQEMYRCEIQI